MMVRRAFTLTEMVVALAVTVLALAVVTTVFSVTTKTAAVSAAIAEVENLARSFADQLQQDLEYCDPSRSILVLVGRTQAAALTEEAREGQQYYRVLTGDPGALDGLDPRFSPTLPAQYSDPRADILMFFTDRSSASKAPATAIGLPLGSFQEKLQRGARVSPIQVVYGHAAVDKAVGSGSTWAFADNPRHIETSDPTQLSPLPAKRWHLARRQALIDEPTDATMAWDPRDGFRTNPDEFDRIVHCYSDDWGFAGDSVHLRLQDYLRLFGPGYNRWEGTSVFRAGYSPYRFSFDSVPQAEPWPATDRNLLFNVLYPYGDPTNHHVATVIEQPPAALQSNLGLHLLPGCVWFQVELLIPEDPRNGLDHPLSDQRRDTPRWVEVDPGQTYVFVPDTLENRQFVESQALSAPLNIDSLVGTRVQTFKKLIPGPGDLPPYTGPDTIQNRRVRLWPYAIRVTVRVLDQRGRLEEPIIRTVVHRFD